MGCVRQKRAEREDDRSEALNPLAGKGVEDALPQFARRGVACRPNGSAFRR